MIESVERRLASGWRAACRWKSSGCRTTARPIPPERPACCPRYRPRLMHDPVREPAIEQSNGMAEAFVKTFKRDYDRVNPPPDAVRVLAPTRQMVRALQRRPSDRKCGRGAVRRPLDGNGVHRGDGSGPSAAQSAVARSTSLGVPMWTTLTNYSFRGIRGDHTKHRSISARTAVGG